MTASTLPRVHKDLGIEGKQAQWMAEMMGRNLDRWVELAKRVASQLPPNGAVLDVATGPGYFCIELAKLGPYAVSGLDLSHTLVGIANNKAAEAGVAVDFREGNVASMPFADNTFDFLLCRGAFKNFGQPAQALQEMYRVLKPGGKGVIKDLSGNAPRRSLNRTINTWGLPLFNRILTKFLFQFRVRSNAYTKDQFKTLLAQTNFTRFDVEEEDIDIDVAMWK